MEDEHSQVWMECIKFLEEKEAQKQKDQKEKQKRKEEREKKRKAKKKEKGKSKKQKKTLLKINICPVGQVSYNSDEHEKNGKEWIQCSCGTWMHEDCMLTHLEENDITFCPVCTEED